MVSICSDLVSWNTVKLLLFHNLLFAVLAAPNWGIFVWSSSAENQFGTLSVLNGKKLHMLFPTTNLNMSFNFSAKLLNPVHFKGIIWFIYWSHNVISMFFPSQMSFQCILKVVNVWYGCGCDVRVCEGLLFWVLSIWPMIFIISYWFIVAFTGVGKWVKLGKNCSNFS